MEEIKKQFEEVVKTGLEPISKQIEEQNAKLKGLEEKVEKIEQLPMSKGPHIKTTSSVHCGYNLSNVARALKNKTVDNKSYDCFRDEEKVDEFSKFMIDFIQAKRFDDVEAKQRLFDMKKKASMQEDTASEGGYTVPKEYQWDFIQLARDKVFAINECDVIQMSRQTLYLPKELTLASVAWTNEETAATQGEPTFDQVTLTAKKLDGLAIVSNELLEDTAVDIVSMLSEQFSYAILYELDNQVAAGTGSPVSGLMKGTAGTSVVLGSGSANFSMLTGNNFSDAISRLTSGYLAGAKWLLGQTAKHYVRTLKDTTNSYIYQQMGAGSPSTIWEYPIVTTDKAPANAVSTVAAVFGNLKNFKIGRRVGVMSLDVDPYGKFAEYQTRFRVVTRWGLALGNSSAFVSIKTAAS